MIEALNWLVFAGAIMHARKLVRKADPDYYDETWRHIWRIQYQQNYPLTRVNGAVFDAKAKIKR